MTDVTPIFAIAKSRGAHVTSRFRKAYDASLLANGPAQVLRVPTFADSLTRKMIHIAPCLITIGQQRGDIP